MNEVKYAKVAIIGKSNVGKSTLMNSINNKPICVVCNKQQTTRNAIRATYKDETATILFIDTPGFHIPKFKLDHFLNDEVKSTLNEAHIVLYMIDARNFNREDDTQLIEEIINQKKENIFLLINKMDQVTDRKSLDKHIEELKTKLHPKEVIYLSAMNTDDAKKILELIKKYSFTNVVSDYVFEVEEQNDKFMVRETIRKVCLEVLKQEVPHGINVEIEREEYNQERHMWYINANLVVEKKSHKPIVIGKGGTKIKEIGMTSRKLLEELFDCQIMLHLFVKVEEDWRNDPNRLKAFGYSQED
ncbi:GTPase Era [Ureaplasma canigenitalium]|uniref:GTPase Era n=1 Tax=Ureaplasma canigenitalium TaxID=42092 RepID=UPI0004E15C28|nr:GTPase Era [Ureaplasma canigenitalium]